MNKTLTKKRIFKIFTVPLSWIYNGITSFRNFLYDAKILETHEFETPVISIGNITVGGTGKTPHTECIVSMLKDIFDITILSRGYKRKTKGFIKADSHSTVAQIGDEPLQMARKFANTPNVSVAVCEDRAFGIKKIEKDSTDNSKVLVVLDDAFQHRKVTPCVNILLIDYNRQIFDDHLLPWGYLRESPKECARANIVIISKCPDDLKPIDRRVIAQHTHLLPSQAIFFTRFKYLQPKMIFENTFCMPEINNDTHILLITGIANADPLINYVKSEISNHLTHLSFGDHHNFSTTDISNIAKKFDGINSDNKVLLTTEKDAMRLRDINFADDLKKRMCYLPIEVNFVFNDKENLKELILKYVEGNKANYKLHTTVRQF